MTHHSGTIASQDGMPLFYEHWAPDGDSWRTLVIVQGRGEHTGRYADTASALAAAGVNVWAVDLRGQGKSGGQRGHIEGWKDFLADVQAVITHAAGEEASRQPVLLGHSMGGLIALHYAAAHPEALAGLILSSPLCGLATPVAAWEDWVASRIFNRWWPTFAFHRSTADATLLSHAPGVAQSFLRDPLVHFRVTARLFCEIRQAMGRVEALAPCMHLPTLVLQAGEDRIVSIAATRRMFDRLGAPDKRLIVYEGFYHEIFNEIDAARVVRDVVEWLKTSGATRQ